MHILYLVPHLPNPTKARSHYQIRGLVEAGHTVTVASLTRKRADHDAIDALRAQGVEVTAFPLSLPQAALYAGVGYLHDLPLQARLLWSGRLARAVDRALQAHPADIVHAEHLRMACYGLHLNARYPVVWDAIDHLGSLFQVMRTASQNVAWRIAGFVEARRLSAYERWLTARFPLTLVIGRRDQALFQRDNPYADRVEVASPGLPIGLPADPRDRADATIIMTGTMDYHPNVTSVLFFVNKVLPHIWRERPDTCLKIVGARPVAAIRKLADPRIEVTGFVPAVEDYLREATLAVAPIVYAGGLQNKVLEAFLAQTPVVATTIAVAGLDVQHGREVFIADTPEAFAASVCRLLADPNLRFRAGKAGRKYVEKNHDLRQTTRHLVALYEVAQHRFNTEQARP